MYDTLAGCSDCVAIIANGDLGEGDTVANEAHTARMLARVGAEYMRGLFVGNGAEWFSWQSCEICGGKVGGTRVECGVLLTKGETA